MQVEILRNDRLIAGPIEFDAARVRDIVARQGGDYRLVPNGLTSGLQVGSIRILPVKHQRPPIDSRVERYGSAEREVSAHEVTYTYPVVKRDVEEVRQELKIQLASYHEQKDQGRFEYQGVMIASDLEARINAKGVLEAFENGTLTETYWRGRAATDPETGEEGASRIAVTSTEEMRAIYDAIFGRLNACFAAREAVDTALDAANEDALATFDVHAEFDAITDAAAVA